MTTNQTTFAKGDKTGAKLIKIDGKFYVDDNGTKTAECVVKPYRNGRFEIHIQPNSSNRKIYDLATANQLIEKDGSIELTYKPSVILGKSTTSTIPNAKLVEYLNEADRKEYEAIIARAKAARDDAKAQPKTEEEKLQDKINKATEALAKLQAAKKAEAEVKSTTTKSK